MIQIEVLVIQMIISENSFPKILVLSTIFIKNHGFFFAD